MGKLYCWSCMKQYGTTDRGDVYVLGQCCSDNTYSHLEDTYPQPVQMELL